MQNKNVYFSDFAIPVFNLVTSWNPGCASIRSKTTIDFELPTDRDPRFVRARLRPNGTITEIEWNGNARNPDIHAFSSHLDLAHYLAHYLEHCRLPI